jgi:glycine hydroxymethyltransferase
MEVWGDKLKKNDTEVGAIIGRERERQHRSLEMIASENFTSSTVMEAVGSVLMNKYSEGYPNNRYYGGNEHIDEMELLCQKRALECFHLSPEEWGVNVQSYSGSIANWSVYAALLNPHDRIMGLDLPSGGHLTHGYRTDKRKVSNTSIFFESMPYRTNSEGYIDYDVLESSSALFRPDLIVCGGSAYCRDWDYARLRKVANDRGCWLMADMAHVAGLVAVGDMLQNPFEYCDVVTTTTHKTLRGPRGALIFYKKKMTHPKGGDLIETRINNAVFPGTQGGPHDHTIAGIAVALKEASTPAFHAYSRRVVANAQKLAAVLQSHGYELVTGGTDNHIVLWNLMPAGLSGNKMEYLLEAIDISVNKNTVPSDTSAFSPGGIRLGTSPLTTRGLTEDDFVTVAGFLHAAVQLALTIQKEKGKKLVDFKVGLHERDDVKQLKAEVNTFAQKFDLPGVTC